MLCRSTLASAWSGEIRRCMVMLSDLEENEETNNLFPLCSKVSLGIMDSARETSGTPAAVLS